MLIFKFIDFLNGNLDLFNESRKKYKFTFRYLSDHTLPEKLYNLAGKEIIDNLVKDDIICGDEYKIKEGQENNFKKNMKLKFTDLQYILNLIENIDIYMYFDKTDEDAINKRYNKNQIIYNMYKKNDNIDNFIKYFIEKLKEEAGKGNNLILDKIKWKIVYLYTFGIPISKLNIIMNKNYLGIYYDQNTKFIIKDDKDTEKKN